VSQPTKQRPQRKPPPKKADENTEKAQKFAEKLRIEINHHFGVQNAKLKPCKLWSVDKVARYRINWWDWNDNKIVKTAFIHVSAEGEGDDMEIKIEEVTA